MVTDLRDYYKSENSDTTETGTYENTEHFEEPSLGFKVQSFMLENYKNIIAFLAILSIILVIIYNLPQVEPVKKPTGVTLETLYIEKSKLVEQKAIQTAKIKRLQEQQTLTQSGITAIDSKIKTLIIKLEK